jgi:hypothetical protein
MNLISPIHHCPDEVFERIFLHVSSFTFFQRLPLVCKRWLQITSGEIIREKLLKRYSVFQIKEPFRSGYISSCRCGPFGVPDRVKIQVVRLRAIPVVAKMSGWSTSYDLRNEDICRLRRRGVAAGLGARFMSVECYPPETAYSNYYYSYTEFGKLKKPSFVPQFVSLTPDCDPNPR